MPNNSDFILTEALIRKTIEEDEELEIVKATSDGLLLYDSQDAKYLPVRFLSNMSASALAGLIHISSAIPKEFLPDKAILAEYLWNNCDRNAFITLNELVVIWDDGGYSCDPELERLADDYGDEYAKELACDYLGQLWNERNIVVINIGNIVETAKEISEENKDTYDSYFSFENQVLQGFLQTAIHELRHLQMETNIFLPEEEYPLHLAGEFYVEAYCIETYEDSIIPINLISFEETEASKEPLDQKIHAAKGALLPNNATFVKDAEKLL